MNFTDNEISELRSLAYHVWTYIAGDICMSYNDSGETVIPKEEITEVVLDADRLLTFSRNEEDRLLAKRLYELPYEEMMRLIQPVFPSSEYV